MYTLTMTWCKKSDHIFSLKTGSGRPQCETCGAVGGKDATIVKPTKKKTAKKQVKRQPSSGFRPKGSHRTAEKLLRR